MNQTPPGAIPMPVVPGLSDLSVFARGGYATVYRATQGSVGRQVAVKIENRTLDSPRDQQRFLREARAAAKLSSHPHVVDLFDAGVTADRHPYLIMELCDGSYADRMRSSPLDAAEARDIGVKIADALNDAHSLGVLHRDVKPANILFSRLNPASLADFGLAVLAEVRDPTITIDALTPAYAAPEMFRHAPPSPAVDVYALCATLYAVMRGKPPRWRDEGNPSLVMMLELFNEPIPDLPGIPPALTEVLRWGMANDPGDRPSAAELRDLLATLPLNGPGPFVSRPGPVVPRPARPGAGVPGVPGVPAAAGGPPAAGPPPVGAAAPGSPPSAGPPLAGPAGPLGENRPGAGGEARPGASGAGGETRPGAPGADHSRRAGRRRRRLPWFLGGAGILAALVLAGIGLWRADVGADPDPGTRTPAVAVSPSSGR